MENTVVSCEKIKDWEKDGRKVPIYKVTLSDGSFGESFGKEIPTGTLASDLIIEEGQYGKKIKMKASGGGGFKKSPPNNAAFAMAYSKDLVIAGKIDIKDMSKYADLMYQWIEGKVKS